MSIITLILTKQTTTSHIQLTELKKTTLYRVGNPGPGLGQRHTCGRAKLVNYGGPSIDASCRILLPSYIQSIWPSSFKGEDFVEIDQPETIIAYDSHGSRHNEQSL